MTLLGQLPENLRQALKKKALLKIIAGLSNFDPNSVEQIASAAGLGKADLLDVACDPALVRLSKNASGLPICVSAVDPDLFPAAIDAGASMIEIGNFDSFYPKGRFFSAKEVLELAVKTKKIVTDVPLSVTVPHILSLDKQAQLALELVAIGVDVIQTEGGTSAKPFSSGVLGCIEKAAPSLAAVHTISDVFSHADCSTPVLCASGLSAVTLPMAIAVGASGVGVGSAVNRLKDDLAMVAAIRALREALSSVSCEDSVKLDSSII